MRFHGPALMFPLALLAGCGLERGGSVGAPREANLRFSGGALGSSSAGQGTQAFPALLR